MFVRVKEKINGKKSIQIVESYRRADQVSQKIVRHVGQAVTDREVEELKKLANSIIAEVRNHRKPLLPLFAPESFYAHTIKKTKTNDKVYVSDLREEQRIVEGIGEVFGKLYSDLGLDQVLKGTKRNEQWNAILKTCVLARIANPTSKLETAAFMEEDYGIKIPVEKIYRMMDHVSKNEDPIKKQICQTTLNLFDQKVDVLFFDVTTLYFESTKADDLKDFGFSKDCKFKETQVVLALVATTDGIPLTYHVFSGNTYEGHTLIGIIKDLRNHYHIANILLVADRAMFNEKNLQWMESQSIHYIVAAKLKGLSKLMQKEILDTWDYSACVITNELHWVKSFSYKSRRLIVGYSNKRAQKDASDRQRLIERLMKKVKDGKIKIQDVIPNQGTKKYLKIIQGHARIDEEKITRDAKWDGHHGVITNLESESANQILDRYRNLWQIEEAFRINKHDLKMRPIYHWTPSRVKAHISICYVAYALVKQALYRLERQQSPMSFKQLRQELLRVQSSLYVDNRTKKKYLIPSHVTPNQKKIYHTFGLKRSEMPTSIA